MLRRHLLFFATGALVALAVALVLRRGDDGPPERSAVTTTAPAARPAGARSVRIRAHHPARRKKTRTRNLVDGTSLVRTTEAPSAPPVRHPSEGGTPTVPREPAQTVPDDEPPPTDTGTDATEPPPPTDTGAAVTIPNPATPDASVGP